jgi:hypothetical protein
VSRRCQDYASLARLIELRGRTAIHTLPGAFMNELPPSPSSSPESNKSTSMGFVTLILLSVGILLSGWALMSLLNFLMP